MRLRCFLLFLLAGAASAQTAPPKYNSAFAGYRAYEEPARADWKELNARLVQTAPADPHAGHDMGAMDKKPAPAKDPHQGHHHKE